MQIHLKFFKNGGSGVLLKDGDITYEFEKSHVIGVGACGCVYLGNLISYTQNHNTNIFSQGILRKQDRRRVH